MPRSLFGEQRVAQVRGGEHHPVHVAGAHPLEHELFPLAIAVGVADQRDVPSRREPVLQGPHDRREQRVGQVRDQHPHGVGAPGPQAPGHRVGVVAEDLGGLEHPARRVLPDQQPGLRVERPRGSGRVNTRPSCDVPQGHRAFSHRHLASLCARGQRPPADRCLTRCYPPAPAIARHSRAAWRRFLGCSGPGPAGQAGRGDDDDHRHRGQQRARQAPGSPRAAPTRSGTGRPSTTTSWSTAPSGRRDGSSARSPNPASRLTQSAASWRASSAVR